ATARERDLGRDLVLLGPRPDRRVLQRVPDHAGDLDRGSDPCALRPVCRALEARTWTVTVEERRETRQTLAPLAPRDEHLVPRGREQKLTLVREWAREEDRGLAHACGAAPFVPLPFVAGATTSSATRFSGATTGCQ